jgi:hypothetical protein
MLEDVIAGTGAKMDVEMLQGEERGEVVGGAAEVEAEAEVEVEVEVEAEAEAEVEVAVQIIAAVPMMKMCRIIKVAQSMLFQIS